MPSRGPSIETTKPKGVFQLPLRVRAEATSRANVAGSESQDRSANADAKRRQLVSPSLPAAIAVYQG
jgi:hypothetical protein